MDEFALSCWQRWMRAAKEETMEAEKTLRAEASGPWTLVERARAAICGHRWLRRDEGGALVEFAIVLPIMLLMLTGISTFGIAINNYMVLTEGTGVGARILAISRGQTLDPCNTTVSAVESAAPNLNPANLRFTYVLNGVSYSGTSCSSSSTSTGAAGNLVQGKNAEVTVTYPCSLAVYGYNYATSCTLQAQTTELVQ
jgi:Flp pilus assembly protein TadG